MIGKGIAVLEVMCFNVSMVAGVRWISGSVRTVVLIFRSNSSNFNRPKVTPKLTFYPPDTISALRGSVCCFMPDGAGKERRLLFSRPVPTSRGDLVVLSS